MNGVKLRFADDEKGRVSEMTFYGSRYDDFTKGWIDFIFNNYRVIKVTYGVMYHEKRKN